MARQADLLHRNIDDSDEVGRNINVANLEGQLFYVILLFTLHCAAVTLGRLIRKGLLHLRIPLTFCAKSVSDNRPVRALDSMLIIRLILGAVRVPDRRSL